MRRTLFASVALGFVLASSVEAVWIDDMSHYIRRGYHHNEPWPWPYVCPDRIAARQPFCVMIENGWRRQNLLGPHHFNAETSRLTTAGELRVRWIMTQAPPERRTIFIERSIEPEITAQRITLAREYSAQVGLDGQTAQVFETHLVSEGRPASVVDATNVRFQESTPPPVLPPTSYTGSGATP